MAGDFLRSKHRVTVWVKDEAGVETIHLLVEAPTRKPLTKVVAEWMMELTELPSFGVPHEFRVVWESR